MNITIINEATFNKIVETFLTFSKAQAHMSKIKDMEVSAFSVCFLNIIDFGSDKTLYECKEQPERWGRNIAPTWGILITVQL